MHHRRVDADETQLGGQEITDGPVAADRQTDGGLDVVPDLDQLEGYAVGRGIGDASHVADDRHGLALEPVIQLDQLAVRLLGLDELVLLVLLRREDAGRLTVILDAEVHTHAPLGTGVIEVAGQQRPDGHDTSAPAAVGPPEVRVGVVHDEVGDPGISRTHDCSCLPLWLVSD